MVEIIPARNIGLLVVVLDTSRPTRYLFIIHVSALREALRSLTNTN